MDDDDIQTHQENPKDLMASFIPMFSFAFVVVVFYRGTGCSVVSHFGWLERGTKPVCNGRVLKTLNKKSEKNTQRGQYLLTMGLGCYMLYTPE